MPFCSPFVDGDSLKACIVKPGCCTCEVQFESFQTGDDWCEKHHSYLTFRCPAMWWFETGGCVDKSEWFSQMEFLHLTLFGASRNSRVKKPSPVRVAKLSQPRSFIDFKNMFCNEISVLGRWVLKFKTCESGLAEVKKIGGMMIICFFVFCGFCHAFLVLDNGVPCRLTFETKVRYSSQQGLPTSLGLSHFKRNYVHNVWPSTNQSRPCPDQCRPSIAHPPKFKRSLSRSSFLHNWCRFPPAMSICERKRKKTHQVSLHH